MDELYFEIRSAPNVLRLSPIRLLYPDAEHSWERNWIETQVSVVGGSFSGTYSAGFMTVDFEYLKQELNALHNNLAGTVIFSNQYEEQLELKFIGDGIGHLEVIITASDRFDMYAAKLSYTMDFDQTYLNAWIKQLNDITRRFPIQGDFKIKNMY